MTVKIKSDIILSNINWMLFVMEIQCVFREVESDYYLLCYSFRTANCYHGANNVAIAVNFPLKAAKSASRACRNVATATVSALYFNS